MADTRAFAVLATDIVVLTVDNGELKVLLTPASSKNFRGIPALPGGLVGENELTEKAVERILGNVISQTNFYNEQLFTFDSPKRDPEGRVVSVAYVMLVPWSIAKRIINKNASWNAVKTITKLAYDHNEIVKAAVKRLKGKITYTNIVFALMPTEFRLSDLQKVYETLLETTLDKRNFVKKIKSLKLLTKTGHKMEGEAHRPAVLYKFTNRELVAVDVF
jgi:8-oxo-dGTP diphosphatase